MNLETNSSPKKTPVAVDLDLEDFDFKPITSGLGFNHAKTTTDLKPVFLDKPAMPRETTVSRPHQQPVRKEMNVYQNDLSMFYGQSDVMKAEPVKEEKAEKVYRLASKTDRIVAYVLDMSLIGSVLSVMLMMMSRATDMEIMAAWEQYPNEVTPLVMTLFCGFYLLYFSISEKTGSTLGKSMMNLRIVDMDNRSQNFMTLMVRSLISLANFASLGLFSWFDLQNKATGSKVIKAE